MKGLATKNVVNTAYKGQKTVHTHLISDLQSRDDNPDLTNNSLYVENDTLREATLTEFKFPQTTKATNIPKLFGKQNSSVSKPDGVLRLPTSFKRSSENASKDITQTGRATNRYQTNNAYGFGGVQPPGTAGSLGIGSLINGQSIGIESVNTNDMVKDRLFSPTNLR